MPEKPSANIIYLTFKMIHSGLWQFALPNQKQICLEAVELAAFNQIVEEAFTSLKARG